VRALRLARGSAGCLRHGPDRPRNCLRRIPNGATMVHMVARLRFVLSCLLVASLGGCGGGSHATSSQDALTIVVDMGGSAGTGGGPGGVGGGSGGTGGQLATATSATPLFVFPAPQLPVCASLVRPARRHAPRRVPLRRACARHPIRHPMPALRPRASPVPALRARAPPASRARRRAPRQARSRRACAWCLE